MLILTRRLGEALRIEPDGLLPPEADPFGWFAGGPIRVAVTGVRHGQVRLGIEAPPALRILRDELPPLPRDPAPAPLPGRLALARKLRILRRLRCWSPESLAQLAGLPVATILEIESGQGLIELGELEALARAFGVTLPALLVPPGWTAQERAVLALIEGEG
jgi:sRNA-binding carbon storage regulator CsrA